MDRPDRDHGAKKHKLGVVSGVYVPVCLSILSILMFLRFGHILGQVGLLGILGLLVVSYLVDFVTTLSLSAVASNGEVKGGGTYYLISRSLGPEFGGSIGLLFYLSQVLNTALNVVGLIDCVSLSFDSLLPHGYWWGYLCQTVVLVACTLLCLAGSSLFAKASNALLVILLVSALSIPLSALVRHPYSDPVTRVEFTGLRLSTLWSNLLPRADDAFAFRGLSTFRDLFGILFPATSGIFAGASMSGDLRNPSKAIPVGTLWAMGSTLALYLVVVLSLAASTTRLSLLVQPNILQATSLWPSLILAGECAVTFFSALMGLIGASKLMQALGRDRLLPGLAVLAWGTPRHDEPLLALLVTYVIAQLALFGNLNQIATFISMGYMVTFFVMNLACFLLKIGSAPNFRPAFQFFSWQTALLGSIMSAVSMFFIDETYATSSVILLVGLFLLIHYLSPPKRWGDVSQNLIYHQVRKYLLRLRPEHIKFWRPQIILLINDPRRQTRLIQFCNSMKKGGLYILGHVIVTDDFTTGVIEAKLQQTMWSKYITEFSRIKAFVQLTMSPSITWGARNLILASGLGGMRPNIAVIGFYNMDELRLAHALPRIPHTPLSPTAPIFWSSVGADVAAAAASATSTATPRKGRRRGDTSSRILASALPTDVIKTEGTMKVTEYLTILEDLVLRHRINVAVAKGFHNLETPRSDGSNTKKYVDLWPIQMSAELEADGKSLLTTNFDTYTLILQLGYILHTVPAWARVYSLRVMVFVEYENEVEEERGRVEALLEKLRISAEVHVFYLASGELAMYEAITQGYYADPAMEQFVNEVLGDMPWWRTIQQIRGKVSSSDDLTSIKTKKRRASIAQLDELQKNQTVSALSRLGVNMGIRIPKSPGQTASRPHYDGDGEDDDDDDDAIDDDTMSDEDDADPDFNDIDSNDSDLGIMDTVAAVRRPLLAAAPSGKSRGDGIMKRPALRRKKTDESRQGKQPARPPAMLSEPLSSTHGRSYGTMATVASSDSDLVEQSMPRRSQDEGLFPVPSMQSIVPSVRFSSSIVPETRITNPEESERTIMFAETTAMLTGRPERPPFSRTNSRQGRLSMADVGSRRHSRASTPRPSVSFAEPTLGTASRPLAEPRPHRPFLTRHSSTPIVQLAASAAHDDLLGLPPTQAPDVNDDIQISIAKLLADYRPGTRRRRDSASSGASSNGSPKKRGDRGEGEDSAPGSRPGFMPESRSTSISGSSYSTQGLAITFNDLPSRAQHLVLNELMRQHSGGDKDGVGGAAVLLTTLPIPDGGIHRDEAASIQYLSDVELLCQELPPVLMIMSNNMTVTVSL